VNCASCRNEIGENETVWYEVIGWERGRGKQRNTKDIFARQRTGSVMCDHCKLRLQHTGNQGQGDLFAQGT
jgi:hypothetical protein